MSALSTRRWALIVAPVAVGTLTLVGVVAHLAPGFDGTLYGNVLLTVAFAIFAAALTKMDPAAWRSPDTLPAPGPPP
jgi:hypothetical protein